MARLDPIAFAERILALLEGDGAFTSTYKFAVMLGLIDLCIEQTAASGAPPSAVTTEQLARRVIELYWQHARVWDDGVLSQARSKRADQAVILQLIVQYRAALASDDSLPFVRAEALNRDAFQRLVDEVEWTLVSWPISRLQVFSRGAGRGEDRFIYEYSWTRECSPRRKDFREYVAARRLGRKDHSGFVNMLRFHEGVPEALVSLSGILRPVIIREWTRKVAELNKGRVDVHGLEAFLFDEERTSLSVVARDLLDLSAGRCMYCSQRVASGDFHVDHFIPWARHPDNSLGNLVPAHSGCNVSKRDFLPSHNHVARWSEWLVMNKAQLGVISASRRWAFGVTEPVRVAHGLYRRLPPSALLWDGPGRFIPPDRPQIETALARVIAADA